MGAQTTVGQCWCEGQGLGDGGRAGVKGLSQLGEAHSCQGVEGPLDEGLVCRKWKAKLVSFLFFPPKFHSDNSRKAYLACVALQDLSIRGQGLARGAVEARPCPASAARSEQTKEWVRCFCGRRVFRFSGVQQAFWRQFKEWVWRGCGEGNLSSMLLEISCCINATYFSCLQTQQTGAEPVGAEI